MPKINEKRIGLVLLKQTSDGGWRVAWWSSEDKKYYRRVLPAANYEQARKMANELSTELAERKGFLPTLKSRRGHTIQEAITMALRFSRAQIITKLDYKRDGDRFLKYLFENNPGLQRWGDLKPFHIEEYLRRLEAKSLAYDTLKHKIQPLRMTSIFMANNFPELYHDIFRRIQLMKPQKRVTPQTLSIDDLTALLEHAREHNKEVYPLLMLLSMTGARVLEVAHLRECDLNLELATIRITQTENHSPKTINSDREIPIPQEALDVLKSIMLSRKIQGGLTYLFDSGRRADKEENQGAPWSRSGICHALKRAFSQAGRDTGHEMLKTFPPRRLRATFITHLTRAGAPEYILQRYVGHSPSSMMREHYLEVSIEDMRREICERMELIFQAKNSEINRPLLTQYLHSAIAAH